MCLGKRKKRTNNIYIYIPNARPSPIRVRARRVGRDGWVAKDFQKDFQMDFQKDFQMTFKKTFT